MPVRAFLDSDGITPWLDPYIPYSFNARQGIS